MKSSSALIPWLFVCALAFVLPAHGQNVGEADGSSPSEPPPTVASRVERPQTLLDAIGLIEAELRNDWKDGHYALALRDAVQLLSGRAAARHLWTNAGYWRWIASSFGILILGQLILFALLGYRIRLMAMIFPRRPLGPVVLGTVGVALVPPLTYALVLCVVGIPFAIGLWATLFFVTFVGRMGVLLSIAWGFSRGHSAGSIWSFFPVYVLYALLVTLDPYGLGTAVFLIVNGLGLGLAIRTRLGFAIVAPRGTEPT